MDPQQPDSLSLKMYNLALSLIDMSKYRSNSEPRLQLLDLPLEILIAIGKYIGQEDLDQGKFQWRSRPQYERYSGIGSMRCTCSRLAMAGIDVYKSILRPQENPGLYTLRFRDQYRVEMLDDVSRSLSVFAEFLVELSYCHSVNQFDCHMHPGFEMLIQTLPKLTSLDRLRLKHKKGPSWPLTMLLNTLSRTTITKLFVYGEIGALTMAENTSNATTITFLELGLFERGRGYSRHANLKALVQSFPNLEHLNIKRLGRPIRKTFWTDVGCVLLPNIKFFRTHERFFEEDDGHSDSLRELLSSIMDTMKIGEVTKNEEWKDEVKWFHTLDDLKNNT